MPRGLESSPFFFKVLVGDFSDKLKIPPKFVKIFKVNVPMKVILKSNARKRGSWTVKVQHEEGRYYFCGGWPNFVRDHGLEVTDFLFFTMIGRSTFHTRIADRSGTEKNIRLAKRRRGRPVIRRPYHEERPPTIRGASTSKKERGATVKRERNVEHDVEFVSESPSREHPSRAVVFKRYQNYYIAVPKSIVKAAGLTEKRRTVVEDPRGRKRTLSIVESQNQIRLSAGWSSFRRENKLVVGDTLFFQFIAKTGSIRIQIVKRA